MYYGFQTGFENEHQLASVFRNYSMVVFGWQALLTAPANYTQELSLLVRMNRGLLAYYSLS